MAAKKRKAAGAKTKVNVPALLKKLNSTDPEAVEHAALALAAAGKAAAPAIPRLVQLAALDGAPELTRRACIESLGHIGDASIVPALAHLVADPSPTVRFKALEAMKALGPIATAAVPQITSALAYDPYPQVRAMAAMALGFVLKDPPPGPVEVLLAAQAADRDAEVREQAAATVENLTGRLVGKLATAELPIGRIGPGAWASNPRASLDTGPGDVPAIEYPVADRPAKVREVPATEVEGVPAGYASRLDQIMSERDLTDAELARRLGDVTPTQVGRWRKGRFNPSLGAAYEVSRKLGLDVYSVFPEKIIVNDARQGRQRKRGAQAHVSLRRRAAEPKGDQS